MRAIHVLLAASLALARLAARQQLSFGIIGGTGLTIAYPVTAYYTPPDLFGNPASDFHFGPGPHGFIFGAMPEGRITRRFPGEAGILRRLRLRRAKSQREIDILQQAVDITAEAFERAYALAVPGTWQYEIGAQFEFTFLRRNGQWGYPPIVAAGVNATTRALRDSQDRMKDGDLLLMDNGAEFDGYTVDVTRTIPVNGKFTAAQANIYRLVWKAQQAALKMARPDHASAGSPESVQGAANQVIRQGLTKLGLLPEGATNQQMRVWTIHGITHGIGLNVHDSIGGELQPDVVVTLEPGIYVRADALENPPKTPENEKFIEAVRPAFEKYKVSACASKITY